MGKPKCPTCLSCMNFVYKDNNRYLHCWLCNTYYGGQIANLQLIESPFLIDCPDCNGVGEVEVLIPETRVSRDMAIDAGYPYMEGYIYQEASVYTDTCPTCNGTKRVDVRAPIK